jgi:hypothetical protein
MDGRAGGPGGSAGCSKLSTGPRQKAGPLLDEMNVA